MLSREITIVNRLGLHARAAAKFVNLASAFDSEISLSRNGHTVNGKSIMGVMMLAASRGTTLGLSAEGSDAHEALQRLETLVAERFGEEE
ncbi:MAG: HPr family phosphocarrier protein [Gammaproteobacteria bacterium]|nr:HPr family phosphocarrier protein [Gammaproteobacteria bacterium]